MKKVIGILTAIAIIAVVIPMPTHAQYGGGGGGIIPPSVIRTGSRAGDSRLRSSVNAPASVVAGQVLGASTFNFTNQMGLGSRGEQVTELQNFLRTLGYFHIESTGYFGPITQAAVKAYQTANSIPSTGFVGPLTLARLNVGLTVATVPTANQTQINSIKGQLVGLVSQAIDLLRAQIQSSQ